MGLRVWIALPAIRPWTLCYSGCDKCVYERADAGAHHTDASRRPNHHFWEGKMAECHSMSHTSRASRTHAGQ